MINLTAKTSKKKCNYYKEEDADRREEIKKIKNAINKQINNYLFINEWMNKVPCPQVTGQAHKWFNF